MDNIQLSIVHSSFGTEEFKLYVLQAGRAVSEEEARALVDVAAGQIPLLYRPV